MGKYFNSFFKWSRLEKPLYKCILRFLNGNFCGFTPELLTLKIVLWPHSKARELISSGQTGPLENINLKGEGKKHPERHSQKTECHGENGEGVCL